MLDSGLTSGEMDAGCLILDSGYWILGHCLLLLLTAAYCLLKTANCLLVHLSLLSVQNFIQPLAKFITISPKGNNKGNN